MSGSARSSLRVVFDTNVFHGAAFDALEASPFRDLCRTGRVKPVYGHVFFEECLRAYALARRRDDLLDRWLPMIFDTAPAICKDWLQTWHEELVQGKAERFWPTMAKKDYEKVRASAASAARDGSWAAYERAKDSLDAEAVTRAKQREMFLDFRKEVAGRGKRRTPLTPVRDIVLEVGPVLIAKRVKTSNPRALASRWSRDPGRYRYFTQFVVNLVYLANFAATENNKAMDLNAQADLDVLTHLLNADLVVSNERGFLKTAFDTLWRPSGKVLMNSEEFVRHLQRML